VRDLLRVNIGPVQLGDLPSGHWRRLHPDEQAALNAVTLAASRQESRQH
jgi:16S rRNA U516 pseudouridylate synthase RsuA-like enzyme